MSKSDKPFICTQCHANLDAVTPFADPTHSPVQPNDTDVTICCYCYAVYHVVQGQPVYLSPEMLKELPLHHQFDIENGIAVLKKFNLGKKRKYK